ncbi:hypothetical protein ACFWXK_01060 [Streptomyces sp. NPDC059070]|uniref:hypothetical protein n=1 Tax=Streptomyces sp. NPDC059070 TaxID=3346713 RepID=UPI00367F8C23
MELPSDDDSPLDQLSNAVGETGSEAESMIAGPPEVSEEVKSQADSFEDADD